MAFNDLLSTSFLFSVAIIIILIGGIFAYVSYRMSEQDHKISSMIGLISTMAEELQFFRSKLSQRQGQSQDQDQQGGFFKQENVDQIHTIPILDPNNLITGATSLIPVSDDEDESESETDSGSDSEDDNNESDSEEDEEDEEDEEYELDEIVDLEEPLQISRNNMDEDKHSDTNNIKSIHLEEPIELNVFNHELEQEHEHEHEHEQEHEHEHEHIDDLLANDLKNISITDLEDTNKKTEYKKMSINKLREVVTEKGILADASKLKKNDLLKLLD